MDPRAGADGALMRQQAFWRNIRLGGIEQQANHGHLRLNDDWPVVRLRWLFPLGGFLEKSFVFPPQVIVLLSVYPAAGSGTLVLD
jgi:hypothetical protein